METLNVIAKEWAGMTDKDVLRYLYLVERRLELLDAGVDWKTEYEDEKNKAPE